MSELIPPGHRTSKFQRQCTGASRPVSHRHLLCTQGPPPPGCLRPSSAWLVGAWSHAVYNFPWAWWGTPVTPATLDDQLSDVVRPCLILNKYFKGLGMCFIEMTMERKKISHVCVLVFCYCATNNQKFSCLESSVGSRRDFPGFLLTISHVCKQGVSQDLDSS